MTRAANVQTARPDEPLAEALEKLISGDLNQLVVIDGGFPVGLLGRGDVLRVAEIAGMFARAKS